MIFVCAIMQLAFSIIYREASKVQVRARKLFKVSNLQTFLSSANSLIASRLPHSQQSHLPG